MHAAGRCSIILGLGALLLACGCRTPKPTSGLIRISEEPDANAAAVEPVPHRLASARTPTEAESQSGKTHQNIGYLGSQASRTVQQARSNKLEQAARRDAEVKAMRDAEAKAKRDTIEKTMDKTTGKTPGLRSRHNTVGTLMPMPQKQSAARSLSDQEAARSLSDQEAARDAAIEALIAANQGKALPTRRVPKRKTPTRTQQKQATADVAAKAKPATRSTASHGPRPQPEATKKPASKESVDAFAMSSPEVQQRAIQRFVASVAETADQTTEPNSLQRALAKSLRDLPTLPPLTNRRAETPPNRLAMSPGVRKQTAREPQPQVAAASISDDMDVVHVTDISPSQPVAPQPETTAEPEVRIESVASLPEVSEQQESQHVHQPDTRHSEPVETRRPDETPQAVAAIEQPIEETITTNTLAQPLTLPMGADAQVVQTGGIAADGDDKVRAASGTSTDETKVAIASGTDSARFEVPLPPLSLATPAPEELSEIDAIELASQAELSTAPQPTDPAKTTHPDFMSDRELYKALLARLTTPGVEESDAERSRRLIMAKYLMVLAGDPSQAAKKLDGLSKQEQQYLQHQLAGLWKMIDPKGHPVAGRRFSSALSDLREATKHLAAATDTLEVRSLSFCTEIEAYGQIKTFPGNRFQPGQQVILYCEIENFSAAAVDQGFETHLQGSYDVYDAAGEKVVSQLLPADRQVSNKYLRDYFIAYQMNLPKQLLPGTYKLQLTMEDMHGKKYGQASIPFEIAQ